MGSIGVAILISFSSGQILLSGVERFKQYFGPGSWEEHSVKLFWNRSIDSRGVVIWSFFFLFSALVAILFSGVEPF